MKILIWTQHFWPEKFLINQLATSICQLDHEVSVLTAKPNYPQGHIFDGYRARGLQSELFNNISIQRLPIVPRNLGLGPLKSKFVKILGLIANYLSFIISGCVFAPFLYAKKSYDVIFVYATSPLLQAIPAIFLGKCKGIPVVLWVQDAWPYALKSTGYVSNKYILKMVHIICQAIYRNCNLILVQSEQYKGFIEPHVKSTTKIEYFPNPAHDYQININESLVPEALLKDINKQFSIVFTGNIGGPQGLMTLLLAAKDLLTEDLAVKIFIIGAGSDELRLKAYIQEHQLHNVSMPGALPIEAMPAIYAAASVLYISLKDDFGLNATLPGKMPGYMSAAKPILASMNGVGASLVQDLGIGIACPAENVQALSQAIVKLARVSEKDRKKMGKKARQYFLANFSLDLLTKSLVKTLSELSQDSK